MRLVIDMQGAQSTGSRNRGIGRYSTSLIKSMCEERGEDEIILVLNGLFPETIDPIRAEFASLLPRNNIRVWTAPAPCHAGDSNVARRQAAEKLREAFLASLQPDAVLVTSLFEGLVDNAVTSIGEFTTTLPTAVVLYDLIPLIHRDIYLVNPAVDRWYQNKIDQLRRADLLLSISESSGLESQEYLCFPQSHVINISTACESHFKPMAVGEVREAELRRTYGLGKPFVMYTGGIDHRKNIEGLIRAYAALPLAIRASHQLAIVCSVHEPERQRLEKLATDCGLSSGQLVMTGFVPEADLLGLYNTCKLFVFPSWHEGFGLPALEAMACGRAVIGANTSSVPEVIGCEDALFDPRSDEAITEKLRQALTDDAFRKKLADHGLKQAARFSWKDSAQRAWNGLRTQLSPKSKDLPPSIQRPRLAYVSPIPSARSGIAEYSAELLPELSRHYSIDVIVCQEEPVTDPWTLANCALRDPEWFRCHAARYDRVLYHFGNSPYHSHMFELLKVIPGVVVLHDFFLSGIVSHREWTGEFPGSWTNALVSGHGWRAATSRYVPEGAPLAIWNYPCNLAVLQQALGVVIHSEYSRTLADMWFGKGSAQSWRHIPHLRVPATKPDRARARKTLGIPDNDFVICSFGLLGEHKLNHRLMLAWEASPMAQDPRCRLVFVGQSPGGEYGAELLRATRNTPSRVEITGWVDSDDYRLWLAAADGAVQLRTRSRGETSGAVLDCMNYGLATIINADGSMADLPEDVVRKLSAEFSDDDLVEALTDFWQSAGERTILGSRARRTILQEHHPRFCADRYAQAIEDCYRGAQCSLPGLLRAIRNSDVELSSPDGLALAQSLAQNFPPSPRRPQLLIDISTLVQCDAKTGIQRVVRALLIELLNNSPLGWQVEPVYGTPNEPGYRYARRFSSSFLQIPADWATDDKVEAYSGDIFLALDLQHGVILAQQQALQNWRLQGCRTYAVIYDLLPLLLPDVFEEGIPQLHQQWLQALAQFDGALTISRAVADDLSDWLDVFGSKSRCLPYDIHYFHLGADIEQTAPTKGMPADGAKVLDALAARPTFLMVGTVEARKGHGQVLHAMEQIWASRQEVNFVIVGKEGWKVEEVIKRIQAHKRYNTSLFWLDGISDEYLEKIYAASSCLIAASEGEGFGLPLIEAARHGLPIIARALPVFKEVAGEYAYYFDNKKSPEVIAQAIENWLKLFKAGKHPRSDSMPWLTWKESANQVIQALLEGSPYKSWLPDDVLRYRGNDARLHTQVGLGKGLSIFTSGQSGFLVYGPHAVLAAGYYRLEVNGQSEGKTDDSWLEVSCDSGNTRLLHMKIPAPDKHGNWVVDTNLIVGHRVGDFEVRVWVSAAVRLGVHSISITPIKAPLVAADEWT